MTRGQVLGGQGWTGRASVQAARQQAGSTVATTLHLLRRPWPEADHHLLPPAPGRMQPAPCPLQAEQLSVLTQSLSWAAQNLPEEGAVGPRPSSQHPSHKNGSSSVPPAVGCSPKDALSPGAGWPWSLEDKLGRSGAGPHTSRHRALRLVARSTSEGTRPTPVTKPRWLRGAPGGGQSFWSHQVPWSPRPRSTASGPPPLARDGDHRAGPHPHPCHQPRRHVLPSGVSEAPRFTCLQIPSPALASGFTRCPPGPSGACPAPGPPTLPTSGPGFSGADWAQVPHMGPAAPPAPNPQGPGRGPSNLPYPSGSADCSGRSVSWPRPCTAALLPSAMGAPPPAPLQPQGSHVRSGAPHPAQQRDWGAEGAGGAGRLAADGAVAGSLAQQGRCARGSGLE